MRNWLIRAVTRYRHQHLFFSIGFSLLALIWIEDLSLYLTAIIVGLTILFPIHGSAMLLIGVFLSVVLGLEHAGRTSHFLPSDLIPAFFFVLYATTIMRWKIVWLRSETQDSLDTTWKLLSGRRAPRHIFRKVASDRRSDLLQPQTPPPIKISIVKPIRSPIVILTVAIVSTIAAGTLEALIPLGQDANRDYRLPPSAFRTLCFACILLATFSTIAMVIRHLQWRAVTGSQGRIYLNSILQGSLGTDLGRFTRAWWKREKTRLKKVGN